MVKPQKATDDQLVRAFKTAALFLIDKVEREGWYWRSNYLREHVGCTTGLRFANERSPTILRLLAKRYPDLEPWIKLKPLSRPDRDGPLFSPVIRQMLRDAERAARRGVPDDDAY